MRERAKLTQAQLATLSGYGVRQVKEFEAYLERPILLRASHAFRFVFEKLGKVEKSVDR